MDYKSAGVDIEKGEALVDWLKEDQGPKPHADKIIGGIGGFASIFKMDFPNIKEPCLVSATDGIGTKLKLAIDLEKYDTLGQDLVAMCANDLICTGAQPLFFLDYFATSKLEMAQAQPFLAGVKKACHQSQMALIGGETAEMPGLYQPKDFDCAGFAVGVVDRSKILQADNVKPGHRALGLASSGFHSNGFSLVRKLYSTAKDLQEFGDSLLTPTALYVDVAMELFKTLKVSAMAHITGGGIHNVSRVLPDKVGLQLKAWEFPEIFKETQKRADVTTQEMLKTFNCGVGLVVVVPADDYTAADNLAQAKGFKTFDLGEIITSDEKLVFPESWR